MTVIQCGRTVEVVDMQINSQKHVEMKSSFCFKVEKVYFQAVVFFHLFISSGFSFAMHFSVEYIVGALWFEFM